MIFDNDGLIMDKDAAQVGGSLKGRLVLLYVTQFFTIASFDRRPLTGTSSGT